MSGSTADHEMKVPNPIDETPFYAQKLGPYFDLSHDELKLFFQYVPLRARHLNAKNFTQLKSTFVFAISPYMSTRYENTGKTTDERPQVEAAMGNLSPAKLADFPLMADHLMTFTGDGEDGLKENMNKRIPQDARWDPANPSHY